MKVGNKLKFEDLDESNLYILHHSKVKGTNKEPERIMFNLETDDIDKDVARLKDYGRIATFKDPDGNYFQLVQTSE